MTPIIVWLRLCLWFHTQYAAQWIFWVVSGCVGRHFTLGSGPELFVCSSLLLGSSIMVWLIAAPILQRFLSEMCQDLAADFSFVFLKNLPPFQLHAWHSARKQCVCASVHVHVHTKEISSLRTFSTGSHVGARCRLLAFHRLDAVCKKL